MDADCFWKICLCESNFASRVSGRHCWQRSRASPSRISVTGYTGRCSTGTRRRSSCTRRWELSFAISGGLCSLLVNLYTGWHSKLAHRNKLRMSQIKIIGAGLAGSEAAWQCARRGVDVELFEMRPVRSTPAHQTGDFAELVCSNSLKSDSENTAPWLLKEEMRRAGSLLLQIARECAVPAGHALAVDRIAFAARVTEAI